MLRRSWPVSYTHLDVYKRQGQHLATTGRDLSAWLRFDLELLEERLLDFFQRGVDQSRLDWLAFQSVPETEPVRYQCGEITGPGTLQCEACGEPLIFHAPSAIRCV